LESQPPQSVSRAYVGLTVLEMLKEEKNEKKNWEIPQGHVTDDI